MNSILMKLILGVGLLASVWGYYAFTQHEITSARAEAAAQRTRADNLSAQLTAAKQDVRIVTEYVDRVRTVHDKGATILKKVPVYVPQKTVAGCTINRGFVRVLNAAAASIDLPAAASAADAQAAGIGLDTVAGSVVGNYTKANAIREQLIALQEWVRAHSAPTSAASTGPP
jgi:hypothetical protein